MNGTLFGMGLPEVLAIAILTLLVFGPDRLPGLMRTVTQGVGMPLSAVTYLAVELCQALDYVHGLWNSPSNRVHVVTMSMGGLPSAAWADAVNALYNLICRDPGHDPGRVPGRLNAAAPHIRCESIR